MGLLGFFTRSPTASPAAPAPHADPSDEAPYPSSVDQGIRARPAQDILRAHGELLGRIKLSYGTDRATFDADLLKPITAYAEFVNLLPATADNFFGEGGGLFQLGLEVAFGALQSTDGHIISGRSSITERRELEPRWRLATFLAGLCSELYRTLSLLVVTNERGQEWPAYLCPLTQWLRETASRRFFVRWLGKPVESRALGLFALPHIVPAATMQHLSQGNTIVVPQMLSCLSGQALYRERNVMAELVKGAAARVIDMNLATKADRYGKPIIGAHIERYLIDTMRHLIGQSPTWSPNQERSRLWHGSDGLYLVWPGAAHDIRKHLEEVRVPGIPHAPETMAEILGSAGVLAPRGTDQQLLWTIAPPPKRITIEAVKISTPELLLTTADLMALRLTDRLETRAAAGQASPAPPPPAPTSPSTPTQAPSSAQPTPGTVAAVDRSPAPSPTPTAGPATAAAAPPAATVPGVEAMQAGAAPAPAPAPSVSLGPAPAAPPRPQPARLAFRLDAPPRLSPQVRDVLARAIESMNGPAAAVQVFTDPRGIFVPLKVFRAEGIEPPVAIRTLKDARMLVQPDPGLAIQTVERELRGATEMGLLIHPRHVQGLDPAGFIAPAPPSD